MKKKEEYVYHVDENNNVIGKVSRKEMRQKNLMHRSALILVFNSKGEILVHRRTLTKDIFPGYYAMFIGGTLSYGESYKQGALRETKEEIGAKDVNPKFLFEYKFDNPKVTRVIYRVYELVYDKPLRFQKEEVQSGKFMQLASLKKFMRKNNFCPDDVQVFNKYLKEFHGKEKK